jgi:dipeptidyl-peptidase 4
VGRRTVVIADGSPPRPVTSVAATPPFVPKVRMLSLGKRELRAGLVLPRDHRPGQRLPVLMDPYGGPHFQRVTAAARGWLEPQWFADQGFAVLTIDGRGTPGRSPAWEREVYLDLATAVLEDQVDGLLAAAEIEPDLDLSRVGIRGWSFGGFLAALAVLRRPDVFHAAVSGAPVTDMTLYDTYYTERYLGTPQKHPEAYRASNLLEDAALLTRPLMLIHGLADDNVTVAHTLQLSQRLLAAGRPHQVLPLTDITHMPAEETVAENLLLLQVDFLHRNLPAG